MSEHAGVRTWDVEERRELDRAPLIGIAPVRADGSVGPFITIGHVRIDNDELIRSLRGAEGAWYRRVRSTGRAEIEFGGRRVAVSAAPAVHAADDVDAAFRARYGDDSGVRSMTRSPARESTLVLQPLRITRGDGPSGGVDH